MPSEAVKSQGNIYYVEVPSDFSGQDSQVRAPYTGATNRKIVMVGISDDTYTEITNGLDEGDVIVQRTITQNISSSAGNSSNGSNANLMRMSGQFTGEFGR